MLQLGVTRRFQVMYERRLKRWPFRVYRMMMDHTFVAHINIHVIMDKRFISNFYLKPRSHHTNWSKLTRTTRPSYTKR